MDTYTPTMFIRLECKKLDIHDIKKWYRVVKELAPSGTVSSFQMPDDNNQLTNCLLVSRKHNSDMQYDIPLTRDLTGPEVEKIARKWDLLDNENDFKIISSGNFIPSDDKKKNTIDFDQDKYNQMCEDLAKQNHIKWYNERVEQGWRYGINYSTKEKTHPLLKPWEQLSTKEQNVDYNLPKYFMDKLNQYGYAIVDRADLNKWLD